MPVVAPVSPFGLRLRQLADLVDAHQGEGLTLRQAVERLDEYEVAEVCQTLGVDDACSAVAMRQLASAVSQLAAQQALTDTRLEPVLRRAVEALESEARARQALAAQAGAESPASVTAREAIVSVRRVALGAMRTPWFGGLVVFVLGAVVRSCGAMP